MASALLPVYILILYTVIYTILGFICSFIAEDVTRQQNRSRPYCTSWRNHIADYRGYYYAFALHVFDEASSISSIIAMYCICEDIYGSETDEWKLLTRQAKPSMILLLSVIMWLVYKLGSLLYFVTIDIFSWLQVLLHLLDCNYLFEMFIAHSEGNKNPIIEWMHRQYVYLCSLPLWFLQFVFLMSFGDKISHSSAPFICILLSILFGLANIFYVVMWCDMSSFTNECKDWYERGFRLRFALRGCQFISRMVWLSYFWIFLGSAPFFILLLILFLNHLYLYFRGYFGEFYYVISKIFMIPDMSTGIGYVNSTNYGKVDWFTKVMYIMSHCGGCIIGIWVIVDEDLLYIDMLCWLHWFEDLLMWAIITGVCDGQSAFLFGAQYSVLWDLIWSQPKYEAFYALGIITWFFSGAYYLVVRIEDFIDRNKQSLSISQGILGLAQSGQWDSLSKFLPRMKKISLNRRNILDDNKTAIHYAILQHKWTLVTQLMRYGANVNIMDKHHQTGVHLICASRHLNDVDLFKEFLNLFDGDAVTKRDNNGKTILHLICENGSDKLPLKERLSFYMKTFAQNNAQFDANIADNNGCTALHYIVEESNDIQCIEILINNGAQIDIQDNKKQTPLIHCVSKNQNNPTTLRYILSNGANINHQDDKGWTALHFAANSNLTDNVFILLEAFPNVTIRNNAGKNAYNLANSMGYSTIADTLKMNMPIEELVDHPIEQQAKKDIVVIQMEEEKEEKEEKEEIQLTITKQPKYEQLASMTLSASTINDPNNTAAHATASDLSQNDDSFHE